MRSTFPGILLPCFVVALLHAQSGYVPGPRTSTFQHVVVIVQENRTPDNLFHGLCSPPFGTADSCSTAPNNFQYNIQTDHWANLKSPTGFTNPSPIPLANSYDLSHSHSGFKAMCDANSSTGECNMDGAINIPCSGSCLAQPQYKYVDNSQGLLNPYLNLATEYGWANYMFQTNQGPSFPAHQFIFGGTSAPTAADDAAGIFSSENMSSPINSGTAAAGCIAASTTTVQLINPEGVEDPRQKIYPCFEHRTIPDVLPSNVTWRYYTPGPGSIWTAPNAIQHICESSGPGSVCEGQQWKNNVDLKPADVLTDIKNCHLRDITWVIPSGLNSDHAVANDGGGPSWVASIVNAIGTNSSCQNGVGYWRNTVVLLTWDDWGGWYDHVAPPILPYPQGGYQLGFRVPLVVISAYTPKRYINNVRHDFGSLLRFIEGNFSVRQGALDFADSRADNDLRLFFDYTKPPRPFKTVAASLDSSFFVNDTRPLTDPDDE